MENKKILVVDDEFTIRYLVEHQLKRYGLETIMAKDGPGALEAARIHKPDLIVLDIMMPDMDGFDVCRQLKKDPDLASIPVLFLTALSSKEDKQRAFALGAADYVTKPFQADEFMAHITAVIQQSGREMPGGKREGQGKSQIVTLFSPKGGVGTTTLAVQLAESLVLRESQQVFLIDLDLPLGGLALMLELYTTRHIVDLLNEVVDDLDLNIDKVFRFSQRHRADLRVIPAPGYFIESQKIPSPNDLQPILQILRSNGYHVLLDLGSNLTPLALAAMRQADINLALTSGQSLANSHLDTFLAASRQMGLDPRRLMPVINELHGHADEVQLARVPIARIPHVSERSRTRLWLQEQGLRKLASVILT